MNAPSEMRENEASDTLGCVCITIGCVLFWALIISVGLTMCKREPEPHLPSVEIVP